MKWGFTAKFVMPGLVPGIHVLVASLQEKTWMAGTSPAMTKKRTISTVVGKSLKMLAAFSVRPF
jgi:hypothetical protein